MYRRVVFSGGFVECGGVCVCVLARILPQGHFHSCITVTTITSGTRSTPQSETPQPPAVTPHSRSTAVPWPQATFRLYRPACSGCFTYVESCAVRPLVPVFTLYGFATFFLSMTFRSLPLLGQYYNAVVNIPVPDFAWRSIFISLGHDVLMVFFILAHPGFTPFKRYASRMFHIRWYNFLLRKMPLQLLYYLFPPGSWQSQLYLDCRLPVIIHSTGRKCEKCRWAIFLFVCLLFSAIPMAYGGSQTRDPVGAAAAGLCHNHSNT